MDSLFDEPEPEAVEAPAWQEVPQPLFLSWSEARQLAYCAARDEANALADDVTEDEMDFLLERAMSYREMMNGR